MKHTAPDPLNDEHHSHQIPLIDDNSDIESSATTIADDEEYHISPKWKLFAKISYPLFGGVCSGIACYLIKSMLMLLLTAKSDGSFTYFFTYFILILTGIAIMGQLWITNRGIKYFKNIEIVPLY